MDAAARVQILDATVYISYTSNTPGKSMNPVVFPPAISK